MPSVPAGLKWPPEMGPTANAIARTERPTANATATRPALGAENSAAPHTAVTSVKVPMNSALNSLVMLVSPGCGAPANLVARTGSCHQAATDDNRRVRQPLCHHQILPFLPQPAPHDPRQSMIAYSKQWLPSCRCL